MFADCVSILILELAKLKEEFLEPKRQEPVEPVPPREDVKVNDEVGRGVLEGDKLKAAEEDSDSEQILKKYKTIGIDDTQQGTNDIKLILS